MNPSTAAGAAPAGEVALEQLDRDLWVATRPLALIVGDIGTRMTVLRLANGDLLLHSPVPLDAPTRHALDALGRVRWVVGPSKPHHFYLGEYAAAYPHAELCGAPGLAEKRRDLAFAHELDAATARRLWGGEVEVRLFEGAPFMNEVVFFHPASRTLILTDLAFNVRTRNRARLFHRLVGATDRFGPHLIVRLGIRDKAAARRSRDALLGWDFDRVVVAHGDVLETGGRAAMTSAFAWLGPSDGA
ncbi:MAG: DUF4336 domain-containing protein [Thermodesulfobacteriota bacterium]